ncbi:MAG: MBL fold metallo-hydrolase [Oscillospiraceae bacterium]|nr:MBL fold metallo-hydrolase [Oscillospiraceae bacterium]
MEKNKAVRFDVLTLGDYGTNCYLCWDEQTGGCAVIDPGYAPETILRALQDRSLRPKMILLTHGHFDHVGAVRSLAEALRLPVYLCEKDLSLPPELTCGAPLFYTNEYQEGDTVSLDALRFQVLETPGHTPGSVCLQCGDVLFTGDTLFAGSCGRTDFSGGSWDDMLRSLCRLAALPGDFTVLPGHGPASTLEEERRHNPCLGAAR